MIEFETAARLEAAGFPARRPKIGDFVYQRENALAESGMPHPRFLVQDDFLHDGGFVLCNGRWESGYELRRDYLLASTAADILPLLPIGYRIGAGGEEFVVWSVVDSETEFAEIFHKDMDEACALAWLDLNEKTADGSE